MDNLWKFFRISIVTVPAALATAAKTADALNYLAESSTELFSTVATSGLGCDQRITGPHRAC